MTGSEFLDVGNLFLAEPIQISKGQVKVNASRWPEAKTISVTHHEDGALTNSFIAEVTTISNGKIRAEKVSPQGQRLVLPGDELSVTIDTITSRDTLVADVSAAANINCVYPISHRNLGAALQVQIFQISNSTAYADVVSILDPGVNVNDRVDVQLTRGSSIAEFIDDNLAPFGCRLDREPTAGGPGVARVTGYSTQGTECDLEETVCQLQIGDRYEMMVNRGISEAIPSWDEAIGVESVALNEPSAASTTATVELTEVEDSVTGKVTEYQNVPEVGTYHRLPVELSQKTVFLDGIPIQLVSKSEVTGEATIEVTGGEVPRAGRITEYHGLPDVGTSKMVTMRQGQDFVIIDGVPIELESQSEINGKVSLEIVEGGLPFIGQITEYHGLPDVGEIIDCRVDRGTSQVTIDGVPVQFSPPSLVGELKSRLRVLDVGPPVRAELIDYPTLQEGETVRAKVDSNNFTVAHADKGNYRIDLVEQAKKAADVRVRLVSVTAKQILGKVNGYLSLGSTGQNIGRSHTGNSPFTSGDSKNKEITGKKL